MNRRFIAFAVQALLLLAVFSGAAGEGKRVPATPTDLSCAHEHTKTTIYFYDSPAYTPIDAESHRVSGPADIETVCLDCNEVLSLETVSSAEEIRPHSIKKGVCVLCGFRQPEVEEDLVPDDDPEERIIIAEEDGSAAGLLSRTLSASDLAALQEAGVSTLLIRSRSGSAAIILNVDDMLAQVQAADAYLYTELADREDGSFFASVCLITASGGRLEPETGGITLRFYRESGEEIRVSVAPSDSDTLAETECIWNERGYWSVPYTAEGTYFLFQ